MYPLKLGHKSCMTSEPCSSNRILSHPSPLTSRLYLNHFHFNTIRTYQSLFTKTMRKKNLSKREKRTRKKVRIDNINNNNQFNQEGSEEKRESPSAVSLTHIHTHTQKKKVVITTPPPRSNLLDDTLHRGFIIPVAARLGTLTPYIRLNIEHNHGRDKNKKKKKKKKKGFVVLDEEIDHGLSWFLVGQVWKRRRRMD